MSRHIIHTHNVDHVPGGINPIKRHTYHSVLNINSKFRDNYSITKSNNFIINLPRNIKDIVKMKVLNVILPSNIPEIHTYNNNNNFLLKVWNCKLCKFDEFVIEIENGTYTGLDLEKAINSEIDKVIEPGKILFSFNSIKNTFSIKGKINFAIDFSYNRKSCKSGPIINGSQLLKDQQTLGWQMGFRGDYILQNKISGALENPYGVDNSYSCPPMSKLTITNHPTGYIMPTNELGCLYSTDNLFLYAFDCDRISQDLEINPLEIEGLVIYSNNFSNYYLIDINDFQNNHTTGFISPCQESTINSNNIMAKLVKENVLKLVPVDSGVERTYFGPTDISKLELKIYNEFGFLANLDNCDWSITIQLEIIYDS